MLKLLFLRLFFLIADTGIGVDNSDTPRPAPLVRVKGRTAMNSSPPKASGTLAWLRIFYDCTLQC